MYFAQEFCTDCDVPAKAGEIVLRVLLSSLKVANCSRSCERALCELVLRCLKSRGDQPRFEPGAARFKEQACKPLDKLSSPWTNCINSVQIRSPQILHIDHANPCRRVQIRNRKRSAAFEHRPQSRQSAQRFKSDVVDATQSPQRVARSNQISWKVLSFWTSITPIPAEGRTSKSEIVESPRVFDIDHFNPRRGCHFCRVGAVPPHLLQRQTSYFCVHMSCASFLVQVGSS